MRLSDWEAPKSPPDLEEGRVAEKYPLASPLQIRPGFSPSRLAALMRSAIEECGLDLSDMTVLTEAATGAYGVTPVICAMAGAKKVWAKTGDSRYGQVSEVAAWMSEIAREAGVMGRIDVVRDLKPEILSDIDIVTNSGHLRPLSAALIELLPASAVVALMFEAWELRPADIDLQACIRRGIPVAGVNERHSSIDVFSFLGPLCVRQLHDCGLAVYRNKIAVVCDNEFAGPILKGFAALGGDVARFDDVAAVQVDEWDAIVIALLPRAEFRLGKAEAARLRSVTPKHVVIVQFWGDIDRDALAAEGLRIWPAQAPARGHMAILLSEIGPEPIVRLQTGGLRAAELVWRGVPSQDADMVQLVRCE
jgi:hypothetical protein